MLNAAIVIIESSVSAVLSLEIIGIGSTHDEGVRTGALSGML